MIIYGVALLAFCALLGLVVGDTLGLLLGVKANVGGVGFSMILLLVLSDVLTKRGWFKPVSASGVIFWSGMYIPIVVAMAAQQNVVGALKGGPLAFLPVIARIGRGKREGGP